MKTNKKVVLGFAIAMVFSLTFIQGNSMKSIKQNLTVQQISIGAGYMSEGGSNGGWEAAWAMAGAVAYGAATGSSFFGWCPAGWAGYAFAGGAAL